MELKEFIVKKEFLSHDSKRCYKAGDKYKGGNSKHTRMLMIHGFIVPVKHPKLFKRPRINIKVHFE